MIDNVSFCITSCAGKLIVTGVNMGKPGVVFRTSMSLWLKRVGSPSEGCHF